MTEAIRHRLKCSGCGVELQSEDPSRAGYVPPGAGGGKGKDAKIVCKRCFRIRHYNEAVSVPMDDAQFLRILSGIGATRSTVLHIVDLFDFDGSVIPGLHRFVGDNPVVLAVNKADLLPKGVNQNRTVNWIRKLAKENGLKPAEVVLLSAKLNAGFDRLLEALRNHRNGRDIYVVGATNVGKSTLINRLISDYSDLDGELTVSPYPGTTLDVVSVPLEDGGAMIDTPGIVYPWRLTEMVGPATLRAVLPDKFVKPRVYQLDERQTLFFGALARFDFVKGEHQSFTCYVSNGIHVHRRKLDGADEFWEKHRGELLSPPNAGELASLPPLARHSLRIPPGAKMDVSISGLGWIQCSGLTGAMIDVYAPKGVKVVLRPSMI
ncbi:ribosome biogenesis GTPase YqeH [Paenibacillus thermoaerophilus]|uniref:Ribosome biogenesis GTPase YqeH n=1 Tax=Paenibacillus thermoaerophilus TaxID=1215385 RepID=A0ABW2V0Q3_9BACL|nr:ribosome biogenesis GTPase YqeH [Paenibacillus thermoaerophilus]TMV18964.1 ribosome biogenesis GTPase YqeH [Paenibacillus thermoaerophilus]